MTEKQIKTYKQFQLNEYPEGLPILKTWKTATITLRDLKEGEILIKLTNWSLDPYMRPRMKPGFFSLNSPVQTLATGHVISSKSSKIQVSEILSGLFDLSEYFILHENDLPKYFKCLKDIKESYFLSALGMPGGTAYYGVSQILEVKKGDSLFVNAAEGAVGSVVGMHAKALGSYVVGCAGGEEKCKLIKEVYKFDDVIDYQKYNNKELFLEQLKLKFPKGIDKYFDNVGGYQTDAAVGLLNKFARVAVCGQISQYNKKVPDKHEFQLGQLIYKSIRIEGFVYSDLAGQPKLMGEFFKTYAKLVKEGKIVVSETVFDGFEKIPEAFLALFTGKKKGKVVVASK